MQKPPENCVQLRAVNVSNSGFIWAFELCGSNHTKGKGKLFSLEQNLEKLFKTSYGKKYNENNVQENQVN